MAEAVIENRPPPVRFFCHKCNIEFEHVLQDYTCPFCTMGFIEKLEENNSDVQEHANVNISPHPRTFITTNSGNPIPVRRRMPTESPSDVDMILFDSAEENVIEPPHFVNLNDFAFLLQNSQQSGSGQSTAAAAQPANNQPRESRLLQLVQQVVLGGVGGEAMGPLVVLGGRSVGGSGLEAALTGEYIMTGEELDTIMSQLLWQVESDGPPPLSAQDIDSLPEVIVNSEQTNQGLQCSICWEQFILDEKVRELSCGHLYHQGCIQPWLSLHATCPICRKSLSPPTANNSGSTSSGSNEVPQPQADGQRNSTGTNLAFLLRACGIPATHTNIGGSSSNVNDTNSSTSSGASPPPQNTQENVTAPSSDSNTAPSSGGPAQTPQRGSLSDLLNQLVSMSGALALNFTMGGGAPIVTASNMMPPASSSASTQRNPTSNSAGGTTSSAPPTNYDSDMEYD